MSGAHRNEHDLMYLVSAGIEWNCTILSNASGVSHDSSISISEGQCCEASHLPFAVDCHSLHLGEGITDGGVLSMSWVIRWFCIVCEHFSRPRYLPMLMEMF
jgi:hypothetical protein